MYASSGKTPTYTWPFSLDSFGGVVYWAMAELAHHARKIRRIDRRVCPLFMVSSCSYSQNAFTYLDETLSRRWFPVIFPQEIHDMYSRAQETKSPPDWRALLAGWTIDQRTTA